MTNQVGEEIHGTDTHQKTPSFVPSFSPPSANFQERACSLATTLTEPGVAREHC
jgi:hypothetical protein